MVLFLFINDQFNKLNVQEYLQIQQMTLLEQIILFHDCKLVVYFLDLQGLVVNVDSLVFVAVQLNQNYLNIFRKQNEFAHQFSQRQDL